MPKEKSIFIPIESSITLNNFNGSVVQLEQNNTPKHLKRNDQLFFNNGLSNTWLRKRAGGVSTTIDKHLRYEDNILKVRKNVDLPTEEDIQLVYHDTFVSFPFDIPCKDAGILNDNLTIIKQALIRQQDFLIIFENYRADLKGGWTKYYEKQHEIYYQPSSDDFITPIVVQNAFNLGLIYTKSEMHLINGDDHFSVSQLNGKKIDKAYLTTSQYYPDKTPNTQPQNRYITAVSADHQYIWCISLTGQLLKTFQDEAFCQLNIGTLTLRNWGPTATAAGNNEPATCITGITTTIDSNFNYIDTRELGFVVLSSIYNYFDKDLPQLAGTSVNYSHAAPCIWNYARNTGPLKETDTHRASASRQDITVSTPEVVLSATIDPSNTVALNTGSSIYYPIKYQEKIGLIEIDQQALESAYNIPFGVINGSQRTAKTFQSARGTYGLYFIIAWADTTQSDTLSMLDENGDCIMIKVNNYNPQTAKLIANGDYIYLIDGSDIQYIGNKTPVSVLWNSESGLNDWINIGGITLLRYNSGNAYILTANTIKKLKYNNYTINQQSGSNQNITLSGSTDETGLGTILTVGEYIGIIKQYAGSNYGVVMKASDISASHLNIYKMPTNLPGAGLNCFENFNSNPKLMACVCGNQLIIMDLSQNLPGHSPFIYRTLSNGAPGPTKVYLDEHGKILIKSGRLLYEYTVGFVDPEHDNYQIDQNKISGKLLASNFPTELNLKKILDRYYFYGTGSSLVGYYCCGLTETYNSTESYNRAVGWVKDQYFYCAINNRCFRFCGGRQEDLGNWHTHGVSNTIEPIAGDVFNTSGQFAAIMASEKMTSTSQYQTTIDYVDAVRDFNFKQYNTYESNTGPIYNSAIGSTEDFTKPTVMLSDNWNNFWDQLNYKSSQAIYSGNNFLAATYDNFIISPVGIGLSEDHQYFTDPAPEQSLNFFSLIKDNDSVHIITVGKHVPSKIQELTDFVYLINTPALNNVYIDVDNDNEFMKTYGYDWNNRISLTEALRVSTGNYEHDQDSIISLMTGYNLTWRQNNNLSPTLSGTALRLTCTRNQKGFPLLDCNNKWIHEELDFDVYSTQTGMYSTSIVPQYGSQFKKVWRVKENKYKGTLYMEPTAESGIIEPLPLSIECQQTESQIGFILWGTALSSFTLTYDDRTLCSYYDTNILYKGKRTFYLNGQTYFYNGQSTYLLDIQDQVLVSQDFITNQEAPDYLGTTTEASYSYSVPMKRVYRFSGARKTTVETDFSSLNGRPISAVFNQPTNILAILTESEVYFWKDDTVTSQILPDGLKGIKCDSNNRGVIIYTQDDAGNDYNLHYEFNKDQLTSEYIMLKFFYETEFLGQTSADPLYFNKLCLQFRKAEVGINKEKPKVRIIAKRMLNNILEDYDWTFDLNGWNSEDVLWLMPDFAGQIGVAIKFTIESPDSITLFAPGIVAGEASAEVLQSGKLDKEKSYIKVAKL